jgi:hypothetical protein
MLGAKCSLFEPMSIRSTPNLDLGETLKISRGRNRLDHTIIWPSRRTRLPLQSMIDSDGPVGVQGQRPWPCRAPPWGRALMRPGRQAAHYGGEGASVITKDRSREGRCISRISPGEPCVAACALAPRQRPPFPLCLEIDPSDEIPRINYRSATPGVRSPFGSNLPFAAASRRQRS